MARKIVLAIAAVVLGYLIFALGSMTVVLALFHRPVIDSTLVVALLAMTGWLAIGVVVGLVAAKLGGPWGRQAAWVVAGLVVLVTGLNLLLGVAIEPNWYKVGVLVVTAPTIVVFGSRMRQES